MITFDLTLLFVLLIIAGIANAIMDTLQFRFYGSVFKKLPGKWWDPKISWRNKWKDGDPQNGEKFWGSSRWFVRFTDAWHFFQSITWTCLMVAIVLYSEIFVWWVDFILFYFVFTSSFSLFYSTIFKDKS